jgi:chemotaxis protein MotB
MAEEKKQEQPVRAKKPKKSKAHGHHGGSWKVAYADFVTAMMALFLVLWLVSQGDQKLKQSIANYFRSPGVFEMVKGGILDGPPQLSHEKSLVGPSNDQELYNTAMLLKEKFNSLPEFKNIKDQIKIDMIDEGLRIQIVDKNDLVMFELGSAVLKPTALAVLEEVAKNICQLPNKILIGGHTDAHHYPNLNYTNWELSVDRANAARRALVSNCVNPDSIFRVVGYAETVPLIPDNLFAPGNRRISIVLLGMNKKMPNEEKLSQGKDF